MTADAPRQATTMRATDRPGDPLAFRSRVAAAPGALARGSGDGGGASAARIELRHFAVLIVLVNRGPTQ